MTEKEKHSEIIVIGAGLAGLLTAWYLKEAGKQVLILEADKVASGQTGRTTAKITSQHGIKYSTLIKKTGRKTAQLYANANQQAIDEYECLIKENKISCEFKRCPAYLYAKTARGVAQLKEESDAAVRLGIPAFFTGKTELPITLFEIYRAFIFSDSIRKGAGTVPATALALMS